MKEHSPMMKSIANHMNECQKKRAFSGTLNALVGQTLTIEQEVAILDWFHDTILDQCETIEQARDLIVDETVRLMDY